MTDGVQITSAESCSDEELRQGMIRGFEGYAVPMNPSLADFKFMMRQRGLCRDVSSVALVKGQVAAIWLVSLDGQAAYLIASGTGVALRGQGIARRMAEHSFALLAAAKARTFQTEVMQGNTAAQALYLSLGMTEHRRLRCFTGLSAVTDLGLSPEVEEVAWSSVVSEVSACRDWHPSWQNNDAALLRCDEEVECLTKRDKKGLVGYLAYFRPNATIAQIAVRPGARRGGVAKALIGAMALRNPDSEVRLLNAYANDAGFGALMTATGAKTTVDQLELIRDL